MADMTIRLPKQSSTNIHCILRIRSSVASKFSLAALGLTFKGKYEPVEFRKKWIVVTSALDPSNDVAKLAAIEGWHLLVVGDFKTPTNWSSPGVEYLGVDRQHSLGYHTMNYIPYNSYTRKNIGYLYAIQHGAHFIYDNDDDNLPVNQLINFNLDSSTSGLIYKPVESVKYNVTNPYTHFGQPTIWPRGYPLEAINHTQNNNTYTLCRTFKTPTIQQGLVNGDPDVDAIFRLTRQPGRVVGRDGSSIAQFNITFDWRAPAFALPEGVFAPFNSRNTLFTYEALWALVLPTSVSFRVMDIWRGYWAQRLMWLLGDKLAFLPPSAVQARNPHSLLEDFDQEMDVYGKSGHLVDFLCEWNCSQNVSFFQCARQLSMDMAKAGFWSNDDADLMDVWLTDLKTIGYREPTIMMMVSNSNDDQNECGDDHAKNAKRVYFSPVSQADQLNFSDNNDDPQTLPRTQNLVRFCGNYWHNQIIIGKRTKRLVAKFKHENLLLIIVFNHPFHQVIPLLENLYYEHFPNIVYCGNATTYEDVVSKMSNVDGIMDWIQRPLTFIKIRSHSGSLGYKCAIRALEMNYSVDGYLIVGDDVLFNFWNLGKLDLSAPAYVEKPKYLNRYLKSNESDWMWWQSLMGHDAINDALDDLQSISTGKTMNDGPDDRLLVKEFLNNLRAKKLENQVAINTSDFYYLPRSKREMFLIIARVFLKHKVFLEIAVPTIIDGLDASHVMANLMHGKIIWGADRVLWQTFYSSSDMFLHPAKLSGVFINKNLKAAYCQTYLKALISKLND